MRALASAALALALAAAPARASPFPSPAEVLSTQPSPRKLHGRFLHVTDMHPDQFYTYNATVESSCQLVNDGRDDPEANVRAGYWGTPRTECDSPLHLVERALGWAAESFGARNGLDFIIWTGDNVRHDTGPVHPRTRDEILEFNKWCIMQLKKTFPGVPIVPAIGNNDIYPHNIMWPGPNDLTFAYARMWSQFGLLPESEAHVCSIGGYFAHDVVPATLTVFSLNTIYWFKSNKIVDGCNSRRGDPGGLQLDWLEAQLTRTRNRGMQAHLIGHVPPNKAWYFDDCYQRYSNLVLRFQDTIVGQHYGHQNYDLFTFHTEGIPPLPSPDDPEPSPGSGQGKDGPLDPYESLLHRPRRGAGTLSPYDVQGKDIVALMVDNILRVPSNVTQDVLDRYSVASLSPSLLPNWYPTIRVWTYNTSSQTRYRAKDYPQGLVPGKDSSRWEAVRQAVFGVWSGDVDAEKKKKKKKRKNKKTYHRHPASPARQNRFLTPLGYSEWHLDLDVANKAYEANPFHPPKPEFQLEYATYPTEVLWQEFIPSASRGRAERHIPVPKALLAAELARYSVAPQNGSEFVLPAPLRTKTDWEYAALTLPAYLDLSIRLRTSRKNYLLDPPPPSSRTTNRGAGLPGRAAETGTGTGTETGALEASLWGRFMARLTADSGVTIEDV